MKHYYFNYHADYMTHMGRFWAFSKRDVELMIFKKHPKATNIDIWVN